MPKSKILNWLYDRFGRTKKQEPAPAPPPPAAAAEPEAKAVDCQALAGRLEAAMGDMAQPIKRCTDACRKCHGRNFVTVILPSRERVHVPCAGSVKPDPGIRVPLNRRQLRATPGYIKDMRFPGYQGNPDRFRRNVRRHDRQRLEKVRSASK